MTFPISDDQSVLQGVQSALTVIIREFDRVCSKLGLRYVVYGGTALGAVRHQGFIPWDDDADVAMTRPEYERFLAEAPRLLGEGFSIENSRTNALYPNMFSKLALKGTLFISEQMKDNPYRMPIALDIFPLDVVAPSREAYRRQSRETWFWGRMMYLQGTPRPYLEVAGPLRSAIFCATETVYGLLRVLHIGPRTLQRRWERSARRFERTGGALMGDFTDRRPLSWATKEEDLYPALQMPFGDITVPVPRHYDAILTRGYGDYMQLPPEDKRKTHEPFIIELGLHGGEPQ